MKLLILGLMAIILAITIPLLLVVAFLTLAERKAMASMQRRKGANVIRIIEIFRVFGSINEFKLVLQEFLILNSANLVIILLTLIFISLWSQLFGLLEASVTLGLVGYILSLSIYIITKRFYQKLGIISTILNLILCFYMVVTPSTINEPFLICGFKCGFTQLTASILLLNTLFLCILLVFETFFFTERSQRGVVFSLGCLLSQVITPLTLTKITALKLDGELLFSEQVISLVASFLISQGIVGLFFFILNWIEKQRIELGKTKFELRYSPILFFFFFLNPTAIGMVAWGQRYIGINLLLWVYLPLFGISLLLWGHSKCKAQIKEEWILNIRDQVISHIFLFIVCSRLVVFLSGLLDGSIVASGVMLLFWIIDAFYLQTVSADIWICMMMPADLRSAEGTPTGGPQTSSAEPVSNKLTSRMVAASPFEPLLGLPVTVHPLSPQISTQMSSGTAAAACSPELNLPRAAAVETAATPVAQGQVAQQVFTQVDPATDTASSAKGDIPYILKPLPEGGPATVRDAEVETTPPVARPVYPAALIANIATLFGSPDVQNLIFNLQQLREGTATAGAAASPNDPAPGSTSSAATGVMAIASAPEPGAAPVETTATPTTQQIVEKFGFPGGNPGAEIFYKSLGYFGLQGAVEDRVFLNNRGTSCAYCVLEDIIKAKNMYLHQMLESLSHRYRGFYLEKVKLDYALSVSSREDLFDPSRNYEALQEVSDTHRFGSFESQILKLVKEYGQHSQVVFVGYFDKIKELAVPQKEWGDDLASIPASDRTRVQNLISIETKKQASFDNKVTQDKPDFYEAAISKIKSWCEKRLEITTETSSPKVETPNQGYHQITNHIRRTFSELRLDFYKDITQLDHEIQRRTLEVRRIGQELKRIGR